MRRIVLHSQLRGSDTLRFAIGIWENTVRVPTLSLIDFTKTPAARILSSDQLRQTNWPVVEANCAEDKPEEFT